MSAPATEEIREVERLLVIASDSGEPRTFASLREELGMGHEDLEGALQTLVEHGKAREVMPGEWTGPDADAGEAAAGEPERVVVSAPDVAPEELTDEGLARIAAAEGHGELSVQTGGWGVEPTVRLTMAIAAALDAAALGALIKAGIDDAATREGEVFVLEVLP